MAHYSCAIEKRETPTWQRKNGRQIHTSVKQKQHNHLRVPDPRQNMNTANLPCDNSHAGVSYGIGMLAQRLVHDSSLVVFYDIWIFLSPPPSPVLHRHDRDVVSCGVSARSRDIAFPPKAVIITVEWLGPAYCLL